MLNKFLHSKLPKHTLRESGDEFIQHHRAGAGFTLIELLVVIAIIGALSAIAVVITNSARDKAKEAAVFAELSNISPVIQISLLDNKQLYCKLNTACLNQPQPIVMRTNFFNARQLTFLDKYLQIKTAQAAPNDPPPEYFIQRVGRMIIPDPPAPQDIFHPVAQGGFEISQNAGVYWPDLSQYGWEYSDMILYDFSGFTWEIHAHKIADNTRRVTCGDDGCRAYTYVIE